MYSHSKLKQDIISNFQLLKQPDFLEALKVRWKNGGNVPHLEIDEVVLIYYNVNNSCQQNSRVLHTFVPIIWSIIKYLTPKYYIFKNF